MSGERHGHARPSGVPLGRAFVIRQSPFNDDLLSVIRTIESVHQDGPLPTIPLRWASELGRVQARFKFDSTGPGAILVNPEDRHWAFSLVHEVGHFVDFSGLWPPNEFSSESQPELDAWRSAVEGSRCCGRLQQAIEVLLPELAPPDAAAHVRLLTMSEWWARSYTQYVTTVSRNSDLVLGLERHRRTARADPPSIDRLLHWEEDDFSPIAAAIEELFRRLEWRSPG